MITEGQVYQLFSLLNKSVKINGFDVTGAVLKELKKGGSNTYKYSTSLLDITGAEPPLKGELLASNPRISVNADPLSDNKLGINIFVTCTALDIEGARLLLGKISQVKYKQILQSEIKVQEKLVFADYAREIMRVFSRENELGIKDVKVTLGSWLDKMWYGNQATLALYAVFEF